MTNCCSFETEVKGVMFYEGKEYLKPDVMLHVYFERDAANMHHNKAYMVRLCCNNKILGHLSVEVAEAIYDLHYGDTDGQQNRRREIKLLGYVGQYYVILCGHWEKEAVSG